jgi:hypothetical protein
MEKGYTPPPLMENSIKKMFVFIETFPKRLEFQIGPSVLCALPLGVAGH